LTSIQGTADAALAAGIYGYQFANAAEIVRSYSGWAEADQTKFQTMLHDVFFSINYDFLNRHDGQTDPDVFFVGWDLCQVAWTKPSNMYLSLFFGLAALAAPLLASPYERGSCIRGDRGDQEICMKEGLVY
jgi:hypothetical protein